MIKRILRMLGISNKTTALKTIIETKKIPKILCVDCPKCNKPCFREHRGLYMMWGMKCSSCGYVFDVENKYYKEE